MADYQVASVGVVRESDGATIPATIRNSDWRIYLKWLDDGGVPDPIPIPPAPPVVSPAGQVESSAASNPAIAALIRRTAKVEGITERALLDEIRLEAKE